MMIISYLLISVVSVNTATVLNTCLQGWTCRLPNCRCQDGGVPGKMTKEIIPQVVIVSFDGSVTEPIYQQAQHLLVGKTNPNGCPISVTFFVSTENTKFSRVKDLFNAGSEIGLLGVPKKVAKYEKRTFGKAAKETWIKSQLSMLSREADIPIQEIRGWRNSLFKKPGESLLRQLKNTGFKYDSSLIIRPNRRMSTDYAAFPFTLDYEVDISCNEKPCEYSGKNALWEIPFLTENCYSYCISKESCQRQPVQKAEMFRSLTKTFQENYFRGRSPLVLNFPSNWLTEPPVFEALDLFLKLVTAFGDVYFVSMHQTIEWTKFPKDLSATKTFIPWQESCKRNRLSGEKLGTNQKSLALADEPPPAREDVSKIPEQTTAKQVENFNLNQVVEKAISNRRQKILSLYQNPEISVSQKKFIFFVIGGVVLLFIITASIVYFFKSDQLSKRRGSVEKVSHNAIFEFAEFA